MKLEYESPEIEICLLDAVDVITTSDYWGELTESEDWVIQFRHR